MEQEDLYGMVAEFESPTALVRAANRAREAGYRKMDAYSPIPIEELHHALGLKRHQAAVDRPRRRPDGAVAGYGLQFWASTIAYPLNIGGRPLHSWPSFIVPAFETTILFSAAAAVLGMIR